MARYRFFIMGRLPGLNEYTSACRSHPQVGARMKREAEQMVIDSITAAWARKFLPERFREPVRIRYEFIERDKRRDQDNVSSFGRKVIQDALVRAGLLENDGWGHVAGSSERFNVDRENPRIYVEIEEVAKDGSDDT